MPLCLTASCDLFNGPKVDLFKVISDEVDWASAAKVAVTVAFPPAWGVSPQMGTGKCGDTRVGYEFEINFSVNQEYAMLGWRAYRTADMPENWTDNPETYLESEKNPIPRFEGIRLPSVGEGGGAGKVTVTAAEDITLVPYSWHGSVLQNKRRAYNKGQSRTTG